MNIAQRNATVQFHTLRQSYKGRMYWCTQTSYYVKQNNPSKLLSITTFFMSCHFFANEDVFLIFYLFL